MHRRPSCIIPLPGKKLQQFAFANTPSPRYFVLLRRAGVASLPGRTARRRGNLACCRPPTLVDLRNELFGSGTAASMKLADKAADMKDRVTAAKPWTNSTIPAKHLQALSTPQPQLCILAASKFPAPPTQPPTRYTPPPTTFVRPTSRGWLMTLGIL